MSVPQFGGTGFIAKEIVQDLMHTTVFLEFSASSGTWRSICIDVNTFCVVGPGARKGLNRLHGRPVRSQVFSKSKRARQQFLEELVAAYKARVGRWPSTILGAHVADLELHDVQGQLCELDKHARLSNKEGAARRYNYKDRL